MNGARREEIQRVIALIEEANGKPQPDVLFGNVT
jgi:hypothetical protein